MEELKDKAWPPRTPEIKARIDGRAPPAPDMPKFVTEDKEYNRLNTKEEAFASEQRRKETEAAILQKAVENPGTGEAEKQALAEKAAKLLAEARKAEEQAKDAKKEKAERVKRLIDTRVEETQSGPGESPAPSPGSPTGEQ